MPQLTFHDILAALDDLVQQSGGPDDTPISGAHSNSRRIAKHDCFVAVRGARQDGARFIPAALAAGASAIVAESAMDVPPGVAWARVSDGYAAAGRIAACVAGRPSDTMRLLGITGTNGKTTCAFLLEDILRAAGHRTGMIGTVHYRIGDTLTEADRTTPMPFELQRMIAELRESGTDDLVLEVSSHALAQQRLGTPRFAAALFTNLSGDHLDYHGDMNAYYETKKRLFTELLAHGSPALINIDDPYGKRLHAELANFATVDALSFTSAEVDAEVRMVIRSGDVSGGTAELSWSGGMLTLETPMIGQYNLYNAGMVAALALQLGISPAVVAERVRAFHGAPGRLQPIRQPGKPAVFVDYAHTDDALNNVLKALREVREGDLAVVFGCGGDRDRTKRPRMARAAETYADRIYVTSDNPRTEDPEKILDEVCGGFSPATRFRRIPDRREAIRNAIADSSPNSIILVAGKGHETYQEINGTKHPFDDAEEVQNAL